MSKITDYTENSLPLAADMFVMVDDPAGTALTQKVSLLNLLQVEFGSISVAGGSASQSPGAAYALCTQFTADGLSSAGMTPAHGSNKITVTSTGIYLVGYSLSYIGANSATSGAAIFWNGVEQSQIAHQRTMGAAASIGVAMQFGFVDVSTGATDIDLRIKTSSGIFNIKESSLIAIRVGST